MSCAHHHLFCLSLLHSHCFFVHVLQLRHTANTPKCPCLWHFMHLPHKVYLAATAFFVLYLIITLAIEGLGVKPDYP
jgi:hypothetical protein